MPKAEQATKPTKKTPRSKSQANGSPEEQTSATPEATPSPPQPATKKKTAKGKAGNNKSAKAKSAKGKEGGGQTKKKTSKKGTTKKTTKKVKTLEKKTPPKEVQRDVLYPSPTMKKCEGDKALTVKQVKDLLGWTEESENVKFGSDFLLKGPDGSKVRLLNNTANRPIYPNLYQTYAQEHLRRKWRFNGETIIIGRTGLVLEGQHQMIGLIFAAYEWEQHPGKWKDYWQTEPTMEKFIVLGIAEDDDTVNTINTGKPRSMTDVIFRSALFRDYSEAKTVAKRKNIARIADYAVRGLWERTGAKLSSYSPIRTHSESIDFINRHPRILEAVKHINEENGTDNKIGKLISPGLAAAILYLQGSAKTEREKNGKGYAEVDDPNETQLDWSLWDDACEFWVLLAQDDKSLKPIRKALLDILEDEGGNKDERSALIVKAWNLIVNGKKLTPKALELEYETNEDEQRVLAECPVVGGIDLGKV